MPSTGPRLGYSDGMRHNNWKPSHHNSHPRSFTITITNNNQKRNHNHHPRLSILTLHNRPHALLHPKSPQYPQKWAEPSHYFSAGGATKWVMPYMKKDVR
eukprot:PhF_6_TR40981/c0_g1_i1/m.62066